MTDAVTDVRTGPAIMPVRLLAEKALTRRVTAGDRRAFAELFRRHRDGLYGYCISILRNPEDAADVLQSTMTRALAALPGEQRELRIKPWLFRVAHNECVDLIRARRPTEELDEHALPASGGVEATVADRERLRQILEDLEHLPDRQRSALVMRELNGLDFAGIGLALGVTSAAAKQLVYEARCSIQVQSEGREMQCDAVRQAISERDGRILLGRRIRAHLRSCSGCRDFGAGVNARTRDLKALVPPVPAAVAMSVLQAIGSSSGGSGGLAGLAGLAGGKAALGGGAAKTVAVIAVTAGIGAGTVGVIEKQNHNSSPAGNVSAATGSSTKAGPAGPGPAGARDGIRHRESGPGRDGVARHGARGKHGSGGPGAAGKPPAHPVRERTVSAPGAPGRSGETGKSGTGPPAQLPAAAAGGQARGKGNHPVPQPPARPVSPPHPVHPAAPPHPVHPAPPPHPVHPATPVRPAAPGPPASPPGSAGSKKP